MKQTKTNVTKRRKTKKRLPSTVREEIIKSLPAMLQKGPSIATSLVTESNIDEFLKTVKDNEAFAKIKQEINKMGT